MQPSATDITNFQQLIWNFYTNHGRTFAWRNCDNPYHVVISEIMLQQTQTYRVEPKFDQWIAEFPTFESLAHANLRNILSIWQGLGYNRRAKFLHELAQIVASEHRGQLPASPELLKTFPGIGPATAASICAFAFNMPTVFIETNIRTVFIHTFFSTQDKVHDKQLLPLVAQTVPQDNPREWYYALMDYGVELKKQYKNPSRRSVHHNKQSRFDGSDRQIRGAILRYLTQHEMLSPDALCALLAAEYSCDPTRAHTIATQLFEEKFIQYTPQGYIIK